MISGLRLGAELRRFRRAKLGRIAVLAIIFIPLMYSALYLWAFWNPFGNVDKLPVAFVNDDAGATLDGKPLHAGDKVVEGLKDHDEIHFDYVDQETATKGVEDGDYYFMVRLTPEFSKAVISPKGTEAQQAVVQATYNSTNGYLSTLIGENTMRELVPTISNQLGEQVVDRVLVGLQDAGTGMAQAADGASQLKTGADTLHDGLQKAGDGVNQLSDGMNTAVDGSNKLYDGAQQLDSKMGDLVNGANQLADGTSQLKSGVDTASAKLQELTAGVSQLEGGLDQLGGGAAQINQGVQQINGMANQASAAQTANSSKVRDLANQLRGIQDPKVQGIVGQLDGVADQLDSQGLGKNSDNLAKIHQLADGTAQLSYQLNDPNAPFRGGFNQLSTGTGQIPGKLQEMVDGINKLDSGSHQLASGASQLKEQGTSQIAVNMGSLRDGLVKLNDGTTQLKEKMPDAVDGAKKLADGSDTLSSKLGDGSRQIPAWNENQRVQSSTVMANPAGLKSNDEAGNQVFGSGLAPFFLSLALFIGGLITFLLLRPIQNRAVASGVRPLRAALDGLWPAAIIAMLQASVIVLVTLYAVGLDAAHPIGLWFFTMLVSVTFCAINQMLNVALGPGPGKVASMALLMLQILASNGLYPVETEPKLFEWLHPWNPWTYSVNGFRQLMYGNLDGRLPQAILALLFIFALSLAITSLCARRDRLWTIGRLHPAIQI